jgi:adenosylcobinamide hydrolase
MEHDDDLIVMTSLYVHLLDQLDWKLLKPDETVKMGRVISQMMAEKMNIEFEWQETDSESREKTMEIMADNFTALMAAGTGGTNDV